MLAILPDYTRFHSFAGLLTFWVWEYFQDKLTAILPALGTHSPLTKKQRAQMFGAIPGKLFRVHDWRHDTVTLGEVPADFVCQVSDNKANFSWPDQVNKLLLDGGFDLILSLGQVVPHEVIGMANFNKN